jgi:hypothetical protein
LTVLIFYYLYYKTTDEEEDSGPTDVAIDDPTESETGSTNESGARKNVFLPKHLLQRRNLENEVE